MIEEWFSSLPPALASHRAILTYLRAMVTGDKRWLWLELSCSVAEGRGDALSDLDMGLGVAEDAWPQALEDVSGLLAGAGDVVDMLRHGIPTWGDRPHERFFVQYASGVQVDLVAFPAVFGGRKVLPSVLLHDPHGMRSMPHDLSLLDATAGDVREWAFLGWTALADLDKYTRRSSAWEALERLGEARGQVWRLWAVARGVPTPGFGMTAVLDHPKVGIPPGIEETVASLDTRELRRAGMACARLLEKISREAGGVSGAEMPERMGRYVISRLKREDGDG